MLDPFVPVSDSDPVRIPIHSIVRAVCEAAAGGPEVLYEVMLKMSLMVEATGPNLWPFDLDRFAGSKAQSALGGGFGRERN
jgi:hypothetical protein